MPRQTSDHQKSGVYKLTRNTCHRSHIGQPSRNLKLRYQEHARYIKHNKPRSAYALRILNCRHEYGTISDTTTLLKHTNKLSLLLPYVQMYIKLFHHNNQLIPEQCPNEQNPMFQLLHNRYHTSHPTWHSINTSTSIQLNQFHPNLQTRWSSTQVITPLYQQ